MRARSAAFCTSAACYEGSAWMAGTSPAMTAVRIANCPAGKSVDTVSSHVARNIFLSPSGKSLLELPRLVPHTRGVSRSSRTLVRDAVDAHSAFDEQH